MFFNLHQTLSPPQRYKHFHKFQNKNRNKLTVTSFQNLLRLNSYTTLGERYMFNPEF